MSEISKEVKQQIAKRRTFAIISHPDAGKTTLTEKFLLYGGAINQAGSVKGKATARHAVSDWMEIEKERGISVTSSVLQFNYDGYCINILDTPGHQDFSEDTYRTLMAADSAVMVIDASKGVEAQTRKLFKVCTMRHIPIFTFINKMDREAKDTFDLLDDIEKVLGIETCPINWPIGCGKEFKGVYERASRNILRFEAVSTGGAKEAKETISKLLKVNAKEIIFTSGGTESDNQALIGCARANRRNGNHLITSCVEHPAILNTMHYLEEEEGFRVTYLPVDECGRIRLDALKEALCPETILVSVMYVNNEIGTVEPIREIGEIAHEHGILFHTDAVQAYGHLPINVDECYIDMLSASGHKLNGPKGIGFLYIRTGVKIRSFIHGGAQERKRRAGTENVPGIVGMGAAVKRAFDTMEERTAREKEVRDYLIRRVENEIPYCRLNGHRTDRLPNNANFSFQFIEGESMLLMLDQNGICGSSGSACTSGSLDPSHVLLAIGVPHEVAHGSLRLTLSDETTKEDLDFTVDKLKEIVQYLRSMSPLYEDFIKKHQQ